MKTIKCSQVGGDNCVFEVTTETVDDAKIQFNEHAKTAHADMMKDMTSEKMAEWNTMFDKVWAGTPDN